MMETIYVEAVLLSLNLNWQGTWSNYNIILMLILFFSNRNRFENVINLRDITDISLQWHWQRGWGHVAKGPDCSARPSPCPPHAQHHMWCQTAHADDHSDHSQLGAVEDSEMAAVSLHLPLFPFMTATHQFLDLNIFSSLEFYFCALRSQLRILPDPIGDPQNAGI